jgi:hypothetical protein
MRSDSIDFSTDLSSNRFATPSGDALGTITREEHLGQAIDVSAHRDGTCNFARHPVHRNSIGMHDSFNELVVLRRDERLLEYRRDNQSIHECAESRSRD